MPPVRLLHVYLKLTCSLKPIAMWRFRLVCKIVDYRREVDKFCAVQCLLFFMRLKVCPNSLSMVVHCFTNKQNMKPGNI